MAAPRRTLPALLLLFLLLLGGALGLVLQEDEYRPAQEADETPTETEPRVEGRAQPIVREAAPRERVQAPGDDAASETAKREERTPPTIRGVADTPRDLVRKVTVTVLREDGGPVRDARVSAMSAFGRINVITDEAKTDVAGETLLEITGGANFRVRAWTRDSAGISERISLAVGEEGAVTVRVVPGREVTGVVTSSEGGGLAGALVQLALATDDPFGLRIDATAGRDGKFDLGVVPEDQLLHPRTTILARAELHATSEAPFLDHADAPDVRIELEVGQTLRGRFVNERGTPVPSVSLQFGNAYANSEDDGRFEFTGIDRRGGQLIIDPDEHVAPAPIEIPPGQGESDLGDIVLADGQPIAGRVVDAQGAGVPGAGVDVAHAGRKQHVAAVQADDEGRFRVEHIGEGEHIVIASGTKGGWTSKISHVTRDVLAGTTDLHIVLTGGLTLLVNFLNESDRSQVTVASAEITVTRTDAEFAPYGQAWGGSRIQNVRLTLEQAGIYSIEVKVPGYAPAKVEGIEVFPDREARIDALLRSRTD